jgi:glycosyltransferase involved in cell wall biosynthesis
MGRVVLEAMGAGIPVIGSDVGGIPHLLRDGETGFVVAGDDSDALEGRMRQLLLDDELRKRLGARGYELAHLELNEQVYVERFTEMVEAAVQGKE